MYEYKIIHIPNEITSSKLNLMGKNGWELVSVLFIESMFSYYFRKIKS